MSDPIPDAPAPSADDIGFSSTYGIPAICGFKIPSFSVKVGLGFTLPSFNLLAFLALLPQLAIAFNCDLNNPLRITAPYGGGRTAILPKSPDDDYDNLKGET